MQRLRHARVLARLVLAWFTLAIGVAVAAPIVQPHAIQLVCTGSGTLQLLVQAEEEGQAPAAHTLDCPLCASVAPPPAPLVHKPQAPTEYRALLVGTARVVERTAAALPARGPPALPMV